MHAFTILVIFLLYSWNYALTVINTKPFYKHASMSDGGAFKSGGYYFLSRSFLSKKGISLPKQGSDARLIYKVHKNRKLKIITVCEEVHSAHTNIASFPIFPL